MLHIHTGERADLLAAGLAEMLARPGADPMAPEVVAVPTRGVERWITQRLSHRLGAGAGAGDDGVCANVQFPFPGALVARVSALGADVDPEIDPWPPERAVWPLLEVVDRDLEESFLVPLRSHLEASSPRDRQERLQLRRFSTVRHLSDLFDRYGVHRPEMVRAWAAGRLHGAAALGTGAGGTGGSAGQEWQAELWRRLRERVGVPSPAERLESALARLRSEPELVDLPDRLVVFGLTRLPASQVEVLAGLALHRDVHLFLLHPSAASWRAVEGAGRSAPGRRAEDGSGALVDHPLLRSWGRDSREMQLVLASRPRARLTRAVVEAGPATLLGRLQADIRADRRPPGLGPFRGPDPRPVLDPGDHSVQVHSCHGRSRQVEVMRDAVLHLLEQDPTLELRDVVVMCPDIEAYAPLVQALFGSGAVPGGEPAASAPDGRDGPETPRIPVRLADRSIRQTNPLLGVATRLLDLATSRVTASEVLDLVSMEPVARRFGLDDADLVRLRDWVGGSGIRWGMDESRREAQGLAGLRANTWAAGLDRILCGVAMGEDELRTFGGVLPLEDMAEGEVDLVGRLAEMLERLGLALGRLSGPQPVGAWASAVVESTEALAAAGPGDSWQHDQLHRVLDEAAAESDPGGSGPKPGPLDASEARSLLSARLAGRPTRANFRTGELTVCTLVPMRSVPHRVIGLLGLDDEVFPRQPAEDGDDLLLADPHVGDRDPRSEDRQLLLDALLAATEHLVVTYSGRDPRTNQPRPPAVPVSELLDVIDRTVRPPLASREGPTPERARDAVVVEHPLQSFDPKNFSSGGLGRPGPWSFDPVNLAGARAQQGPRADPAPLLEAPLSPVTEALIDLGQLVRFCEHPVRSFLRERLGLSGGEDEEQLKDAVPLELDALERWGVGDRLLQSRMEGADPEAALEAERCRGLLPPEAAGQAILDELGPAVERLLQVFGNEPCAGLEPRPHGVNLALPDGRRLVGTVAGVRGSTIVGCVYSNLGPKHRLAAWVRFLALTAARPDLEVASVVMGRGRRAAGRQLVARSRFDPLAPEPFVRTERALSLLAKLVDLYDRGRREPLPLYCQTSAAWASAEREGDDPEQAAGRQWTTPFGGFDREDRDPAHVAVLGGISSFDRVLSEARRADDPRVGLCSRRFEVFAHLLWDDLLGHERLVRAL